MRIGLPMLWRRYAIIRRPRTRVNISHYLFLLLALSWIGEGEMFLDVGGLEGRKRGIGACEHRRETAL
jgi:hypothetical protein